MPKKISLFKKKVWHKFLMIKQSSQKKHNFFLHPILDIKALKILTKTSGSANILTNNNNNRLANTPIKCKIKSVYLAKAQNQHRKNFLRFTGLEKKKLFSAKKTYSFFKAIKNYRSVWLKTKIYSFYLKKRKNKFFSNKKNKFFSICQVYGAKKHNTFYEVRSGSQKARKFFRDHKNILLKKDIKPQNYWQRKHNLQECLYKFLNTKFNVNYLTMETLKHSKHRRSELQNANKSFLRLVRFLKKKISHFHSYNRVGKFRKIPHNKRVKRYYKKAIKVQKRLFSRRKSQKFSYKVIKGMQ